MRFWINLVTFLVVCLSLGQRGAAQLPSSHGLSMDVAVTATGGATKSSASVKTDVGGTPLGNGWVSAETDDYTQNRVKESGVSLAVQLRNFGRTPDKAKLEWYFVAKSVEARGNGYIFESGDHDVTLAASSSTSFSLKSAPVKSVTEKQLHTTDGVDPFTGAAVAPTASVRKSGSNLSGWIVRLMVDGKPYQVRASSPSLEALAKNDSQLAAFPRTTK